MILDSSPSPPSIGPLPVRQAAPPSVVRWVRLGWRDLRETGWPSLLHGLIVTAVSLVIVAITLLFWPLLPGAVSGFVLVGPILATGLYALSRRREQGEQPRLRDVIDAWRRGSRCLFRFALLLVLMGTAWVAVSVVLFHFFVEGQIREPLDFLRYVVTQGNDLFLLWSVLGGLGAALVFSITVVSVPLLLDRDVTMAAAILTSVRVVGDNPFTMLWWALFIVLATGVSIASMMLGFLVLYPLMGHASWHVYRDLVDAGGAPPRISPDQG
ncbi:MAG: DUF2189 domain-containing protein [Gammaproteobacteria bacterium]|jgi:uncharacterized membrane protein|nr:DUF2189 domain-containing protein [Gammaproteobacteria bacterium]